MKIFKTKILPKPVLEAILNPDPLEGEDVIIEDDEGQVVAAIIQPDAYRFLLKKIEAREDELDSQTGEPYDPKSKDLRALIKEADDEK